MELDLLKDWVQIAQGLATIAAILIAGVWAYYVFAVGRSATAQVQVGCQLKQVIARTNDRFLCISVTLTNTGQTRVDELSCKITVVPITDASDDRAKLAFVELLPERVLNEGIPGTDLAWGKMFIATVALEPNETVAEDVLLTVGAGSHAPVEDPGAFAAEVTCEGYVFGGRIILRRNRRRKYWSWRGILDPQTAGK